MKFTLPEGSAPPSTPKRIGRPPYRPSDEERKEVSLMNSVGIPQEQIALFLGIGAKTLRKRFRHELNTSAIVANTKVLTSLFEMATTGRNVSAAIFWAKTRCGFRTTGETPQETENTNSATIITVYNNDGEPNLPV
jgi:hypothetical protein